jgi:endoglycosylceramidase
MRTHFPKTALLLFALAPLSTFAAAPLASLSSCGGFLVDPATQRFVDGCGGRQRFFRGINKVEKSPPYFPHPDVFSAGDSATPGDAALQQSLGFNALRLGVMWAGAAPARGGGFNATYLATLTAISTAFGDGYGVNTLVDAHQDLLSEAFCADGAPIWLAHDMAARAPLAFPLPVGGAPCAWDPTGRPAGNCCAIYAHAGGGRGAGRLRSRRERQLQGWADYYATSAVSFGFQQLYTNATFSDQFAAFYAAVASAFTPLARNLVGYEVLNEPWAGDVLADPLLLVPGVADAANLQPFYERVAAAVRAVTPRKGVLLYEGVTWDDVFPLGFTALPDADSGLAAISYHYYDLPGLDFQLDIAQRAADMQRLKAGGLLTEFAV